MYQIDSYFVEGKNGRQPNADLIATVTHNAMYQNIPVSLHGTPDRVYGYDDYSNRAAKAVEFMLHQALGGTSGHAFSGKYA